MTLRFRSMTAESRGGIRQPIPCTRRWRRFAPIDGTQRHFADSRREYSLLSLPSLPGEGKALNHGGRLGSCFF
jgi:hypothetical protein